MDGFHAMTALTPAHPALPVPTRSPLLLNDQGSTATDCSTHRKRIQYPFWYIADFRNHNHPGGTCAPSTEDISSTLLLQRLLISMDIMILDHIIVVGSRTYSMIQHGDIDYRRRAA